MTETTYIENYTIEELREKESLSIRTYNVCINSNFLTLNDIIQYYSDYGGFTTLRNCGVNSNEELVRLCINNLPKIDFSNPRFDHDLLKKLKDLDASSKVLSFCRECGLKNLKEIVNLYYTNYSFLNLNGCTQKVNSDLSKICFQIIFKDDVENLLDNQDTKKPKEFREDISLDELTEIDALSARALNILECSNLLSINSILNYYQSFGTFKNLRNAGKKTENELVCLANKYLEILNIDFKSHQETISNTNDVCVKQRYTILESRLKVKYKMPFDTIIRFKEDLINRKASFLDLLDHFIFKGDYFTQRIKDILNKILVDSNVSLEEIAKENGITRERVRQLKIKYEKTITKKSSILYSFTEDVKKFCIVEELVLEKDFVRMNTQNDASSVLIKPHELSILGMRLLNKNCIIWEKGYKTVLSGSKDINTTKYYHNNTLKNFYFISEQLSALQVDVLLKLLLQYYCEKHNKDFPINDNHLLMRCVKGYKIDYSNTNNQILEFEFVIKKIKERLLTSLQSNLFPILRNRSSIGVNSKANKIILDKGHRFSHKFLSSFDPHNILSFDWTNSESVNDNIKSLVNSFFLKEKVIGRVQKLRERKLIKSLNAKYYKYLCAINVVAYNEYGIRRTNQLVIKRNTYITKPERILEVLELNGQPMHISEIYNELNEKYPSYIKDENSIRGSISSIPNLICFGRSSTYGLKEWENNQNIKGGTIRSIVIEFLENEKTPMHINDITSYVIRFRDTNSSSILANLKLMKKNVFVYYYGGYVGLKTKEKEYAINNSLISTMPQISLDQLLDNIFS